MKLKQIIQGIDAQLQGPVDLEVKDLQFDSRRVGEGTLFVAQPGTKVDGHDYIAAAVQAGAVAVVCQHVPADAPACTYVVVPDSSEALGLAAANFYGHPSRRLQLVGITGTNGKTTTVTLLHRLFRHLGRHASLISTIVNKIDDEELPAGHTTPDALELNQLLARMVEAGCDCCFMEVSSHAVVQRRIAGLEFAGAIFSNITHDHLDFHRTMQAYIAAKKGFFDALPATAWALVNIDDKNGRVMVQNTRAAVHTYSLRQMADHRCRIVEEGFEGMLLDLDGSELWCRLVGRFNAYNLLAIYSAALLCGVPKEEVLRQLSLLEPAPGRFQYVSGRGVTAIVDYAHTPDALQNVLDTMPRDGADCHAPERQAGAHQRQPPHRAARRHPRRHGSRPLRRAAQPHRPHHRPPTGHPHRLPHGPRGRHHPRGRQGTREIPGGQRRPLALRRCGRTRKSIRN